MAEKSAYAYKRLNKNDRNWECLRFYNYFNVKKATQNLLRNLSLFH